MAYPHVTQFETVDRHVRDHGGPKPLRARPAAARRERLARLLGTRRPAPLRPGRARC